MDRANRERDVTESIQKEINSLHQALTEQIEKRDYGSTSSEAIARDLKHQLAEKVLQLEKLQQEVKVMQKARDDEYSAKNEFVAFHQSEFEVSLKVAFSLSQPEFNCTIIMLTIQYPAW